MSVDIRPAEKEEMAEYKQLMRNAFLPKPEEPDIQVRPEWTMCAFEDGKLVTTYAAWPFKMRFNGNRLPVAGVTNVTTRPGYRRRGHLRKATQAHFEDLYEKGDRPLAILHAAHAAIYQRYGYGVVSFWNEFSIAPRQIRFLDEKPTAGTYDTLQGDDYTVLRKIYERFRKDRTGYLHRSAVVWEGVLLAKRAKGELREVVIYRENEEPLGYVIYTIKNEPGKGATDPEQVIRIQDFCWLTHAAYRGLWDYFVSMDLARKITGGAPCDDPLLYLLQEPRMLHSTRWDGLMGRIVDVEKALPERGYQKEGMLVFEVTDELCPWNQGCWKLDTSPSGAAIARTTEAPDMIVPAGTLAMLAFGQISATEAFRMGRLDLLNHDALPMWNDVMRTRYRPFCPDDF